MSSGPLVLITGAAGFVGSAIVRAFLAAGYTVRALVRPATRRDNLAGLGVECVEGDIRDPEAMLRTTKAARYVVHAAADYRLWARDPEAIVRTNVEGTRAVMRAAIASGVERVVYTSSVATLAPGEAGRPSDETCRLPQAAATGAYKQSKIAAERLVEAMIESDALPAIIVHPSTPVGPRDIRPTPTGRMVLAAAAGQMPAYVDTGLNLVHVDDVARGHVLALESGAPGRRYILGGDNVMLAEMLREIALLTGRRPPRLGLPRAPLYPLAALAETLARITDREPLLTLDGLRMSRSRMFYTSAKAERELGYHARPYVEGLRDAIAWFRSRGILR